MNEASLWEQVSRGRILRITSYPNNDLYIRLLKERLWKVSARVCGATTARHAFCAGIEQFHKHLTPLQMSRVHELFRRDLRVLDVINRMALQITFETLRASPPVWILAGTEMFLHPPQTFLDAQRAELDGRYKLLSPLPTHRDNWAVGPPREAWIGFWYGLSAIRGDNGIIFYEGSFERPLAHNTRGFLASGQKVTQPRTFGLEPGEILAFSEAHLHGAHLNVTGETRIALRLRISLTPPKEPGTRFSCYYRAHATSRGSLSKMLTWIIKERAARRRAVRFLPSSPARKLHGDVVLGDVDRFRDGGTTVQVGDRTFAVFRINGTFRVLDGLCPREGGLLADGYCEGDRVTSPSFGLRFDLSTGECTNYSPASVKRYSVSTQEGKLILKA